MAQLRDSLNHPHPLVFNDEEERSNQSEKILYCSGCDQTVSGPGFSCADQCGFYLHKKCAEAPLEITNHPFHPKHPLILRQRSGASGHCTFCRKLICELFCYACSGIQCHTKCALLPRDDAGNFIEISRDFHKQHPLVFMGNGFESFHMECGVCGKSTLMDALYGCYECALYVHEKCLDLPLQKSHPYHRKHPLILEFHENHAVCDICREHHRGFFYRCSQCEIRIHTGCRCPIIEDESHHEHPFTLLVRPSSFDCDACGKPGNNVSYICSTCNIQVHKKCISLPRFIRINLHHHPLSRIFFLRIPQHDCRTWDCGICYKRVNLEHGIFYCSKPDCNFIMHVECAMKDRDFYGLVELESVDEDDDSNEFSNKSVDPIFRVVKEIKVGDDIIAAEIIHFSHKEHSLTLANEIMGNKLCDGCVLPILSSFYYCSHCDYFLHKACAELKKKTRLWFHSGPFTLCTGIAKCSACREKCSGFFYATRDDYGKIIDLYCLRCATTPHSLTYQGREKHFLFFDRNFEGPCSACGRDDNVAYRCRDCDFALHLWCMTSPRIAWHRCDKHSLTLTYGDSNDYRLHHYCDICEEGRDPELCFYHCEVCNTTVHPKCALGDYPFIKRGITVERDRHPCPLIAVQTIYYYPLCIKCEKPCQDLALECVKPGCHYIAHWDCSRRSFLRMSDREMMFISLELEEFWCGN